MKRGKYRVVLLSGSRTRAKRLAEDLRDYDLSSYYSDDSDRLVKPGEIMTAYGHIAEGYEYPMLKFTVIAESDIFGKAKKKKKRKIYEGRKIQNFSERSREITLYMRITVLGSIRESRRLRLIRLPKIT